MFFMKPVFPDEAYFHFFRICQQTKSARSGSKNPRQIQEKEMHLQRLTVHGALFW